MVTKVINKVFEKSKIIASGILYNEYGKVLALTLKDTDGKQIHIAPGGRVEQGETLRDCVIREMQEEVGVKVKVDSIAGILEKAYEDGIWTIVLFNVSVIDGQPKNCEENEIETMAFVEKEELDSYQDIHWI